MSTVAPDQRSTTMFAWHARLIERAASYLAHWLGSTAADRAAWKPSIEGQEPCRSALEQVQECIVVNQMFAAVLRGDGVPETWSEEAGPKFSSVSEAQSMLIDSAREIADAVREMTEPDLGRMYETAFGSMPGSVIIELPLANMHYHCGQVNYIQVMYGDKEFSVPPAFMQP